jgi:site-specific DNA-methyltransferase (adenine-specific)
MNGQPVDTVWDDILPVQARTQERIGYPTQKPLALLERIVKASSNVNDIILDAFCGCGKAIVAAQNLGRQWIGIGTSPTACQVMAKRLRDVCNLSQNDTQWRNGNGFILRDFLALRLN